MATFQFDKTYFDEAAVGIGMGVSFDDGTLHFDQSSLSEVNIVSTISLETEKYYAREDFELLITAGILLEENYSKFVDLLQLIPAKFRGSNLLIEFLEEAGLLVGSWLGQISDVEVLLDKYNVGEDYLQYLSDLIDLKLVFDSNTTVKEKRRQLVQAIDWYKMKGTYASLLFIGYLLDVELNLWDLYTSDYANFEQQAWFAAHEGDNPGVSQDSLGYYKSPHLGVQIALTKVYDEGSESYLFKSSKFTDLSQYIELTRPVNVVPNYSLSLYGATTILATVMELAGEVKTATRAILTFPRLNFDDSLLEATVEDSALDTVITTGADVVVADILGTQTFDSSLNFDQSVEAYYQDITKWSLGTGNIGVPPLDSAFVDGTPVLSGTIDEVDITSERARYRITIPTSTIQAGITELTLSLTSNVKVLDCTFPSVDKVSGMVFNIYIDILF